jgi:outer membrane protein
MFSFWSVKYGHPVLRFLPLFAGVTGLVAGGAGHALSLTEVLDRANNSEPGYVGARADFQGAQARERQALGALLPQISANFTTSMNHRFYDTLDSPIPDQRDKYNAHSNQVSLNQPVWRYVNLVGYWQSEYSMEQAQYRLASAEQELFAKLVSVWFDMLAARDDALFTTRQTDAARKQWEIMRRGEELGNNGQPQVDEALAKYQQAQADEFSAETDRQLKLAALEQMTGTLNEFSLPFLCDEDSSVDLDIEPQESWLQALDEKNPGILAARKALEAANEEISKQRAGHQPTVDLVATYSLNNQQVGGFPGQSGYEIWQRSVALQVSLPIFSGGTQSAKVKEAIAAYDKARSELEAARRAAMLATKQAWLGWRAAFAKSRASTHALSSADSALRVAQRGVANGLKSDLDILQAEQQHASAQRDLNKARYTQIASFIRLKSLLGQATPSDTMSLDALFEDREPAVVSDTPSYADKPLGTDVNVDAIPKTSSAPIAPVMTASEQVSP